MVRRLAVVAIALLFAVAAFAQPSSSALSRGLADALYAKLAGGSTVAGTTTFTNLTVSGTCTGCGGGTVAWGAITGTLSAQTDLQSALDLKAPLNSPSFTTPSLGVATATTINKVTITTPAAGSTLTIVNGKTLTVPLDASVSGTNTGDQTSVSGNAGTATILQTARAINGVSFDGSAAITVTAAAGTLSGATLAAGVTASSLTSFGNSPALTTPSVNTSLTFSANSSIISNNALAVRETATNTRTVLRVIPNGTVANSPSIFEFYGTDFSADATNYERFVINSKGSSDTNYVIGTEIGGTGTVRPLMLRAGSSNSNLLLNINGTLTAGGTLGITPTNSTNALTFTAAAAGTGTVTTNGTLVTGSSTSFLAQVGVGDSFTPGAQTAKTVVYVSDNTHLRLSTSADTNASGLSYTITPTTHAIGASGYDSQVTTSRLVTLGGTLAAPAIAIGSSGATPDTALNRGFDTDPGGNGGIVTIDAGVAQFWVTGGQMRATSGGCHGWSSNSGTAVAGYDTTLCRSAAGTVSVGTAANNRLGFDVAGGDCFVASNQTNATATMQTSNCLVGGSAAITVTSGRKYTGVCEFFLSDSVAVDGAQIDFNGGTATATDFRAQITAFDTALNLSTQTTSLAGAGSASTFTGAGAFEVHFTFEPSANGTFLPRFAQVGHTTGTLTLARGSNCRVREM